MSYKFLDNVPQKSNSIDVEVLNKMMHEYKKDSPLAINNEDEIDKNDIYAVYPNDKHMNNDTVPIILERVENSMTLNGYVGDSENATEPKRTLKMDGITNFYISSLTIIGLYVVYRMIKRTI
jgi:hypothetical protein